MSSAAANPCGGVVFGIRVKSGENPNRNNRKNAGTLSEKRRNFKRSSMRKKISIGLLRG